MEKSNMGKNTESNQKRTWTVLAAITWFPTIVLLPYEDDSQNPFYLSLVPSHSLMRAESPIFKTSYLFFYSISVFFFQKETYLSPTKKSATFLFFQNSGDPPSKIDGSPFPRAQKSKKYDLENL